ncbi:MAG: hypothetical protein F6K17_10625 [Okeania sp. SIO3C4]|nr:hypothetical protein [Okeania sp. SIO3C4]
MRRWNRKSFGARFFSEAPENENIGGFLLRRDRWKDSMMGKICLLELHKMKIFLVLLPGKIPEYSVAQRNGCSIASEQGILVE